MKTLTSAWKKKRNLMSSLKFLGRLVNWISPTPNHELPVHRYR